MVGHRSTVPSALGTLALLFWLTAAPFSAAASAYPPPFWDTPGPIASALSRADGDSVDCEAVVVDTIANNILAYNDCAIQRESGTGLPSILNNCFYQNQDNYDPIGLAPSPDTNVYADPQFLSTTTPRTDIHILPASPHPCLNAGNSSTALVPERSLDIDGKPRVVGAEVDIGADELAAGDLETIEFPTGVVVAAGTSTTITAHVYDQATDTDLAGRNVTFDLSAGQITAINGRSASGTSGWGTTDSNGDVTLTVTTPTPAQKFTITATTALGMGLVTRKCEVCPELFKVGFLQYLADYQTGADEYIDAYLSRIDDRYADVEYDAIGANEVTVEGLSTFNVVFIALPSAALETGQLDALTSFVASSGRHKRVVLVGDFGASYSAHNDKLNTIAIEIGMTTQFSEGNTSSECTPDFCRLCPVDTTNYLSTGVTSLWDECSDTFAPGWGTGAHPIAFLSGSPTLPQVMEEDTQTQGSRIAMHDSSMFEESYNDDYDTVPDRNFRFVYSLCTVFAQ